MTFGTACSTLYRMRRGSAIISLAAAGLVAATAAGAQRTTAENGQLFYVDNSNGLEQGTFVNPDGTGTVSPLVGHVRGQPVYLDPTPGLDGTGGGLPPAAFSPDGNRLVVGCLLRLRSGKYVGAVNRKEPRLGLCVENDNGSGRRVLARPPRNAYSGDSDPAWSRDGNTIAFVSSVLSGSGPITRRRLAYYVDVVDADGTGLHRVPEPSACANLGRSFDPSWGPGKELIYECETNLAGGGTMIAPSPDSVAVSTGCNGREPQFSADGTRILAIGSAVDDSHPFETFRASARLEDGGGDDFGTDEHCDWQAAGPAEEPCAEPQTVVWSPDSQWIAYSIDLSCRGNGPSDLYISRLDGSGKRRVARTAPGRLGEIAWLPKASP
ncbi:MAG: hypothetical protein V7644_44 [Actinomycetota bacterium]